tara:strand:- start:629 stop:1006 length:378 start_codon:yes stop_codon:yes gene_type:complete
MNTNNIGRAVCLLKLGAALSLISTGAFAGADLETSVDSVKRFVEIFIDLLAILCVLGGFYFFVIGIMMAIKKSRPETASQVTGGQIAGHLLGGPVLSIAGYFLFTVVNLVSGGSGEDEIGKGVEF